MKQKRFSIPSSLTKPMWKCQLSVFAVIRILYCHLLFFFLPSFIFRRVLQLHLDFQNYRCLNHCWTCCCTLCRATTANSDIHKKYMLKAIEIWMLSWLTNFSFVNGSEGHIPGLGHKWRALRLFYLTFSLYPFDLNFNYILTISCKGLSFFYTGRSSACSFV